MTSYNVSPVPPVAIWIDDDDLNESPDSWMELLLDSSSSRSRSSRSKSSSHWRSKCRSRRRSRSRSCRERWPMGAELKRSLEAKKEVELDCHVLFSRLIEEAKRLNLPIYNRLAPDPKGCITHLLDHSIEYFYIGATVDPLRRWLGESYNSIGRSSTRGDSPMPGHTTLWTAMFLIGLSSNEVGGNAARVLETELIKFAKARWPELCTNRAVDARGQCSGTNFMYVVVRRFDDYYLE